MLLLRSNVYVLEWYLKMISRNITLELCLGKQIMSGTDYTKYVFAGCVKMELFVGICRFVGTVSVRV